MKFCDAYRSPSASEKTPTAARVGQTRVLLELVIHAFQDGATPETIVQRYSTLELPDVYAVVAYYLRHPAEIEGYVARREQEGDDTRRKIEAHQRDLGGIRSRLVAQATKVRTRCQKSACVRVPLSYARGGDLAQETVRVRC